MAEKRKREKSKSESKVQREMQKKHTRLCGFSAVGLRASKGR